MRHIKAAAGLALVAWLGYVLFGDPVNWGIVAVAAFVGVLAATVTGVPER